MPHSAFTDLIRFNDYFYCSFREGDGHVPAPTGYNGKVRVLRSADGTNWESVASLEVDGVDLRDPKLSVTPKGKLMIIIGGSVYDGETLNARIPHVSFSNRKGDRFSEPKKVVLDGSLKNDWSWIWRVTWNNGFGYGVDYQAASDQQTRRFFLVKTKNGKKFTKVSEPPIEISSFPNETTIRFDQAGKMHILVRRERGDYMGILGTSPAPYQEWTLKKMKEPLGGPNFIFLDDNSLCIGSRRVEWETQNGKRVPRIWTVLYLTDLEGDVRKTIKLPSGGDTSYPGFVLFDDKLWVSYYSSHEEKTAVYLAKVPLSMLK